MRGDTVINSGAGEAQKVLDGGGVETELGRQDGRGCRSWFVGHGSEGCGRRRSGWSPFRAGSIRRGRMRSRTRWFGSIVGAVCVVLGGMRGGERRTLELRPEEGRQGE